ncbi:MAG: hypothetical protein A2Z35_06065 [Actinobacteria bacterium RBG_19FT_COMBO_36_27]|nr:MAG: hypothetical protein A2Z35_06065 [Actinobacteria bacterium RBG_19FT_COMBO_36_27]
MEDVKYNENGDEIRVPKSLKIELSIYKKAQKIVKEKTGLAMGAWLRMKMLEYIQENEGPNF